MLRSSSVPPDSPPLAVTKRGPVLVVDELELSQLLLRRIIEHEGYDVEVAERAETALELMRAKPPSAVMLDLQSPVGGETLLDALRQNEASEMPPIFVLVPSGTGACVRQQLLQLGAHAIVDKPFSHEEIVRCLHMIAPDEESRHDAPVSSSVVYSRKPPADHAGRAFTASQDPLTWATEVNQIFAEILVCSEQAMSPGIRPAELSLALTTIAAAARRGCLSAASMRAHRRCALPASTVPPPYRTDLLAEVRKQLPWLRERLPAEVTVSFTAEDPSLQVLVGQGELVQLLGEYFDIVIAETRKITPKSTCELKLELGLSTETPPGTQMMRLVGRVTTTGLLGSAPAHAHLGRKIEHRGGTVSMRRLERAVHWTLELPTIGLE